MVSPERVAGLESGFARLVATYGVPPAGAYPIFDDLVMRYAEPQRHYHTLEHVAEVLKVVGRLAKYADDPNAVQLAAWYHDAVYDPRAKGNEAASAALAVESLGPIGVEASTLDRVARLIRATDHSREPENEDERVLIDADLAILAAVEKRYARYAADVRREYDWVPESEYRKGRAAVLNRFLARPRLYHTPVMLEEGEESARRNLRDEIERLERTV